MEKKRKQKSGQLCEGNSRLVVFLKCHREPSKLHIKDLFGACYAESNTLNFPPDTGGFPPLWYESLHPCTWFIQTFWFPARSISSWLNKFSMCGQIKSRGSSSVQLKTGHDTKETEKEKKMKVTRHTLLEAPIQYTTFIQLQEQAPVAGVHTIIHDLDQINHAANSSTQSNSFDF